MLERALTLRPAQLPNLGVSRAGGEPFSLSARVHEVEARRSATDMKPKNKPKKQREQEPMGIVISGGPVSDTPPLISAYVWGAAPERPRRKPEPQAAA